MVALTNTKLILASASPRRRELISLLGFPVDIQSVDIDEKQVTLEDPAKNVIETARLKAATVATITEMDAIILGADTTVFVDGEMLGKPSDDAAAKIMLQKLRGRVHQVYTGIALIRTSNKQTITDVCAVNVPMRHYSDGEIETYIATGDPMDKAGAYAIQHAAFRPVVGLAGCYAGVLGLPLCHLARALREFDIDINSNIAQDCQVVHRYDCPVFSSILE